MCWPSMTEGRPGMEPEPPLGAIEHFLGYLPFMTRNALTVLSCAPTRQNMNHGLLLTPHGT